MISIDNNNNEHEYITIHDIFFNATLVPIKIINISLYNTSIIMILNRLSYKDHIYLYLALDDHPKNITIIY